MHPPTIEFFNYTIGTEHGRMAYRQWSQAGSAKPWLICAHGLNQNSRHLEALANRLADDFNILVPDFPGRGLSDYLTDKLSYSYLFYVPLCQSLIEQLKLGEIYWLGTSMGGLTGLLLASLPNTPVKKLVLNDIGPIIPKATMQAAAFAGTVADVRFASIAEAQEKLAPMLAVSGITDPAMKEAYIRASLRQEPNGSWRPDNDQGIYHYTKVMPEFNSADLPFWQYWHSLRCPVLLLHGVHSNTLTPEIIAEMKKCRPDIEVVDIPDTGHAPHLMNDEQAELVRHWLLRA
ncbi:MAG: alpha/beta hydrolase fold protein [Proteobacteria bacterium]|nr:alpha/beta hydrolase fold protein [Pseudomonadota bacterium]